LHHRPRNAQGLLRFPAGPVYRNRTRYSFTSSVFLTKPSGRQLLEVNMKKIALAAALSVAAATTAHAGGLEEPVVEPVIIEEDTSGTNAAWVIPVILIALVAAAAAS